jgi:hypothetical protein
VEDLQDPKIRYGENNHEDYHSEEIDHTAAN